MPYKIPYEEWKRRQGLTGLSNREAALLESRQRKRAEATRQIEEGEWRPKGTTEEFLTSAYGKALTAAEQAEVRQLNQWRTATHQKSTLSRVVGAVGKWKAPLLLLGGAIGAKTVLGTTGTKAAVGKAAVGKAATGKAAVGKAVGTKAAVGKAVTTKAAVGKAAVGKSAISKFTGTKLIGDYTVGDVLTVGGVLSTLAGFGGGGGRPGAQRDLDRARTDLQQKQEDEMENLRGELGDQQQLIDERGRRPSNIPQLLNRARNRLKVAVGGGRYQTLWQGRNLGTGAGDRRRPA